MLGSGRGMTVDESRCPRRRGENVPGLPPDLLRRRASTGPLRTAELLSIRQNHPHIDSWYPAIVSVLRFRALSGGTRPSCPEAAPRQTGRAAHTTPPPRWADRASDPWGLRNTRGCTPGRPRRCHESGRTRLRNDSATRRDARRRNATSHNCPGRSLAKAVGSSPAAGSNSNGESAARGSRHL